MTIATDDAASEYTLRDYQWLRGLGADYPSIRVGAAALGAWPGTRASPGYLERLDRMVADAKRAGLYTEFKLTFYDIPDPQHRVWTGFWTTRDGEQASWYAAISIT